MTTPTSEPTLAQLLDAFEEAANQCGLDSHDHERGGISYAEWQRSVQKEEVARKALTAHVDALRIALANAERERDNALAPYTIATREGKGLLAVGEALTALTKERDALQRTVAWMEARLQLEKDALAAWCNGPLPLWLKERVTQTRLHTEEVNGNCMAACFASVLGGDIAEYDAIIDPVIGGNWWHAVEELWRSHGYLIMRISASASDWSGGPDALCFASGTSPRGVRHMCVYAGGEIVHDPHPSRAGLTEITDYSILVPWKELTTPTREGSV